MEDDFNIFEEEFIRIADNKDYIVLSDVLKISLMDDNIEYKINLAHLRKLKLKQSNSIFLR
jgi:hypothetical protein